MLASASGPLGALLMIAPLAAIPVFAVVGVPHFAPLSASPADDEVSEISESHAPATSAPRPTVRRSADDLYAPVGHSVSSRETGRSDTPGRSRGRSVDAGHGDEFALNRRQPIAHPDALDDWEVASNDRPNAGRRDIGRDAHGSVEDVLDLPPDDPEHSPRRGAPRSTPESTGDSSLTAAGKKLRDKSLAGRSRNTKSHGFNPGLLQPESDPLPRSAPLEKEPNARTRREPQGVPSTSGRSGGRRQAPSNHEHTDITGAPEQSGWRLAASRLKELGIRRYRLESQIEEQQFLFRCEYPTPETPNVTELFEAVAETPLEAVMEALRQIDDWLQHGDSSSDLAVDLP